jgi:hypothetical protein
MTDARLLCERAAVHIRVIRMVPAAAVPPPLFGMRKMFLSEYVPIPARTFVILHELTHVVSGHAEELEELVLDATRYPVEDRIADGVAAVGVTSRKDRELPVRELAQLLRELVPVESRAWQIYRAEATAELVREVPDLGRWSA